MPAKGGRRVQKHAGALVALAVLVSVHGHGRYPWHGEIEGGDVVAKLLQERQHKASEACVTVDENVSLGAQRCYSRDIIHDAMRVRDSGHNDDRGVGSHRALHNRCSELERNWIRLHEDEPAGKYSSEYILKHK